MKLANERARIDRNEKESDFESVSLGAFGLVKKIFLYVSVLLKRKKKMLARLSYHAITEDIL